MPTRREFLSAAAIAATARPGVAAQPPAPDPLRVRKNVADLLPNDPVILAYRAGVKAMKAKPPANNMSWEFWATIHRDYCTHNNWYFFPWHRAYLHAFEQVCRAASGDNTFMLPYWDWAANPRVPAAFWGADNPLAHPRAVRPNDDLDSAAVGPTVVEQVLDTPLFADFFGGAVAPNNPRGTASPGVVESGPHNSVHGQLGGRGRPPFDMGAYMSPRDPIFWLHHANVDRLWTLWDARGNKVTTDPKFLGGRFTFPSPTGVPAAVTVADVLSTNRLGYVYDRVLFTTAAPRTPLTARGTTQTSVFAGPIGSQTPRTVAVQPERAFQEAVPRVFAAAAGGVDPVGYVRLTIQGVVTPAVADAVVRAYLNTPNATVDVSVDSVGYAGSFSFFGHGPAAPGHMNMGGGEGPVDYVVNATAAIRRLAAAGLYKPGDPVDITLVATSRGEAPVQVTAKAAKLEVFA